MRLIIMLFLLPVVAAKAQSFSGLDKDSLKRVLAAQPTDSNKVDTYITLGQQYESNIPDSAIYFYQQARDLSKRLNYPAGIVRYTNNITAVYNVQGRFDESLKLHDEALALEEKYQLHELRLKTLINIGVVYQLKEEYQAAADHYLKHLPGLEQTANPQALSVVYGNVCGLYRNLNQPQKALDYARKSYDYAEKSDDANTLARACINLSNALKDVGNKKELEPYLNKAYQIGIAIDDIDIQETTLINMGDFLMETAHPDKYIAVYQKALPLADSLSDAYGKSLALHGIAYGHFMKQDYKVAETKALTTLAYSREHEQRETEWRVLMLLSDIQIALGNLPGSRAYRAQYDSVYNSIVSTDLLKNVQELETKYEVEKKQSQILRQDLLLAQKNRETLRQRNWLLLSLATIFLLVLLWFWAVRYHRQRQQNVRLKSLLEGQSQERQRISQEMHDDMGSGLTSILFLSRGLSGVAGVAGQHEAATRIEQTTRGLVQKMNEIIWTMNADHDTLESLVAYMRLNMAEALDNAGIDYTFNVTDPLPDQALNQDLRRNIYLCAREAVHNIIKHAQANSVQIGIQVDDRLVVTIADNGIGIDPAKTSAFGNGLKNMRRRMETVGGHFDIRATGRGTTAILTAPL